MAPRSRAAILATRIEESAVDSNAVACSSCQRRLIPCVRSPISIRCAGCVRSNYRCVVDPVSVTTNPFTSAIRADIRRLRSSLLAFDRFLHARAPEVPAIAFPGSLTTEPLCASTSPGFDDGFSSSSISVTSYAESRPEVPLSRRSSVVALHSPDASESSLDRSSGVASPSFAGTSNGSSGNDATISTLIPLASLLNPVSSFRSSTNPSFTEVSESVSSPSMEVVSAPFAGPAPLVTDLADAPFEYIDPSFLSAEGFQLPEPSYGFLDFGAFFDVSDSIPFVDQ